MNPPKPIAEDDKSLTKEGDKTNVSTTIVESDAGTGTKPIPEPFPVEPHSVAVALKKSRKRKITNGKDSELNNVNN